MSKLTVELHKGQAYVDLGSGYLLNIGTQEEVKNASIEQITEMIKVAIEVRRFQSIEEGKSRVLH